MAVEQLQELKDRYAPGESVAELCRKAGVPYNRVAYYLRPDFQLRKPPTWTRMTEIAKVFGCDKNEVKRAFDAAMAAVDPGYFGDSGDDLPADGEDRLITAWRNLSKDDQARVVVIAEALGEISGR